jgi:hypothetical protein
MLEELTMMIAQPLLEESLNDVGALPHTACRVLSDRLKIASHS